MNRIPRILPLVGIAVGGVLAVKALADIDVLPKMMAGAQAFAEEAAAKPAKTTKGAAKTDAKADPKAASGETATSAPATAAPATPTPIKVCAPSPAELAKDAGLSPAELQVLQNLGARRTQLDAREGDIDTQLKLLAAAEAKLDTKLQGLNGLKAELQGLLGQTEVKESAEIDRLVIVYGKMKPKDAAAVMIQLEDKVRLPVAAKLKEANLAAILSQMPPAEAKKLTESLAHRYDKVAALAQSATAPPPATPAVAEAAEPDPTAPAKDATPAKAATPKAKRARKAAAAKAPVKVDPASAAATKAVASAAASPTAAKPAATTPAVAAPTAAAATAKPASTAAATPAAAKPAA